MALSENLGDVFSFLLPWLSVSLGPIQAVEEVLEEPPALRLVAPTFERSPPPVAWDRKPSRSPSPVSAFTVHAVSELYPDVSPVSPASLPAAVSNAIVREHRLKRSNNVASVRARERSASAAPEVDSHSTLEVVDRAPSSSAPEVIERPLSIVPSPVDGESRGRTLVHMPSVSDYAPSPSVSPSCNVIRDSRPVGVGFDYLKLSGGFYLRSGRMLVPKGFWCSFSLSSLDIMEIYYHDDYLCQVEFGYTAGVDCFPNSVQTDSDVLVKPGNYKNFELGWMQVSVPEDSDYKVLSYLPSPSDEGSPV